MIMMAIHLARSLSMVATHTVYVPELITSHILMGVRCFSIH